MKLLVSWRKQVLAFSLTLPELAGGWEFAKTSGEKLGGDFKQEKKNDLSCSFSGEENLLAILKRRWWKYMILGVIDIEANYLVIKAYQYTTLTSVQVSVHFIQFIQPVDCFGVVCLKCEAGTKGVD